MTAQTQIAGVIVLYNPGLQVLANVKSYLHFLSALYVIDNSEKPNEVIKNELLLLGEKIYYYSYGDNLGIAKALNDGCQKALSAGYKWALTMDQDSKFKTDSILSLVNSLRLVDTDKTGIVTPDHVTSITIKPNEFKTGLSLTAIHNCMTSGNMLNLSIWDSIGRFKENFFIDFVDHEYCLRLGKHKLGIYRCDQSQLIHELGNGELFKLLGIQMAVTNHNYIRRYYMTRNRCWCLKEYLFSSPKICLREVYSMVTELLKIIAKEKDKGRKIRSFCLGLKDFAIGKYGRYTNR